MKYRDIRYSKPVFFEIEHGVVSEYVIFNKVINVNYPGTEAKSRPWDNNDSYYQINKKIKRSTVENICYICKNYIINAYEWVLDYYPR